MTALPDGWKLRRLDQLLALPMRNGKSVLTRDGGFPVLRLTAIQNGRVELTATKGGAWDAAEAAPFLAAEGDLLVVRGNGSLHLVGRSGLVGKLSNPVAFPDTLIQVRPNHSVVDPRFLNFAFDAPSVRSQMEGFARTTAGIYKVNQTHLSTLLIPVPPLEEQRRIVAILDDHLSRLDAAEDYLRASRRRLAGLRERRVIDAITGAAVAGDREPAALDHAGTADGDLPSLPVGWTWSRLGAVAEVVGGVTKDTKKQSDPCMPEVPYLRVANVQRGRLDLTEVLTIRVSPEKAATLRLQPGDVLLNEGGDRDKLARGWVWESQIELCIHQNHVFRARITDRRVDPYFLAWTTNTFGGKWAERNGKQSVNLASISLSRIRQMPVIVPPPGVGASVAAQLAEDFASLARLESAAAGASARAGSLRRSLLASAFSGELTSTLDLEEEVA